MEVSAQGRLQWVNLYPVQLPWLLQPQPKMDRSGQKGQERLQLTQPSAHVLSNVEERHSHKSVLTPLEGSGEPSHHELEARTQQMHFPPLAHHRQDRKSTRLNSSHVA